jgi:acylphosphatase
VSEAQGNKARVHIWVRGRVQGVGFRAHVEYFARQARLTGWVRNVGFDTVEALAEGEREQLELFVEAVKQGPRGSRVDEAQAQWEQATGEFQEFSVKRSL